MLINSEKKKVHKQLFCIVARQTSPLKQNSKTTDKTDGDPQ